MRGQEGLEQFVRIWQTSETLAEVVDKSGMNIGYCSQLAARCRGYGVPLKRFPQLGHRSQAGRARRIDYGALKRIAQECAS